MKISPWVRRVALFRFKNKILAEDRNYFFLLHSDICCTFPLEELLAFHVTHKDTCCVTMMGTTVDKEASITYGCYVADSNHKMLHYAEHPESFISDTINAGVYVFSRDAIKQPIKRTPSKRDIFDQISSPREEEGMVSMERDLIPSLVNEGKVYVFDYKGFWRSIKNAGGAVYANEQYMNWYAKVNPSLLTQSNNVKFEVSNSIILHPSAQIDPSAKIGPNVYVGPNVKIGEGTRIHNAIILDNVVVKEHACLMYTIIGEDSAIGSWTRIEGLPSATAALLEGRDARFRRLGITVFGKGVTAGPEIIIRNCIVMPHKSLKNSVFNEIIL